MLVTEKDYCDFVVWTERDCSIERVQPNEDTRKEIISKSQEYFVKVVLPELTGKLITRERSHRAYNVEVIQDNDNQPSASALTARDICINAKSNVSASSRTESELICLCQKPYDESEDVIGCDNENCKYVWLHFSCLNIKTVPRGAYYCPDCKSQEKEEDPTQSFNI